MNRTLTTASLFAFAMIAGCATNRSSEKGENVDSVEMSLEVAPGVTINSASYSITGPGSFGRSGTIDVSHSTKLSALIGGLPAGSGFTLVVSAVYVDGAAA